LQILQCVPSETQAGVEIKEEAARLRIDKAKKTEARNRFLEQRGVSVLFYGPKRSVVSAAFAFTPHYYSFVFLRIRSPLMLVLLMEVKLIVF
jgi:hypothetical protein